MQTKPLPSNQIVIDFRTSCSKDEAAAKLLGWLRGPIYPKFLKVASSSLQKAKVEVQSSSDPIPYKNPHPDLPFFPTPNSAALKEPVDPMPYRIEEDQLQSLHSLDCTLGGSLEAQLLELHDAALLEFNDAMDEPDLENKANAVEYWKKQIRQAAAYLCDIDDELANGDESELRLDKQASINSGTPQILLSSLDRWAKKKYSIFIFKDDAYNVHDDTSIEVHQSQKDKEESEENKELNSVAASNLYATLALLVEDFAKKNSGYLMKNGKVSNAAIAKYIEQLGIDKNKTEKNPKGNSISGLRNGKIADNLTEAFKRLNEKLK